MVLFALVTAALVIGLIPDFLRGEPPPSVEDLAGILTLSPLVASIGAARFADYGLGLCEISGIAVLFGYLPMWVFFAVRWQLAPNIVRGVGGLCSAATACSVRSG